MSAPYRIFGAEFSPYSVKVRSYFRYKQIPHEWIERSVDTMDEYKKVAKLPLIPAVATPDGQGMQDSTPIIEKMEALFPDPSIHPADPALAFLSALVEEFGDEWGNKPMFHYRWTYEADQKVASEGIARSMFPSGSEEQRAATADNIRQRMVPRLYFVGSSDATREQIEGSLRRQLAILDSHLAERKFLFGARPAFGDFGLFAQLYECSLDPTPAAIMRESAPNVESWIRRMLEPKAEGDFESWDSLEAGLMPLLRDEIAGLFLPWSDANARAIADGAEEFTVQLEGRPFSQKPQKYHAKSLAALRARYAAVADRSALDGILDASGCGDWLRRD
jgi:glutathione S-transferase